MRWDRTVGAAALALAIGATTAAAAPPEVVASIKPVHSLVAAVMQGVGAPALIVQGAGSEHTYSLRPSEAQALQQADLVFWIGPAMEVWLAKALDSLPADARVVALADTPGLALLPTRAGGMWEPHEHGDEAHADEHEHAEEHAHEADHAAAAGHADEAHAEHEEEEHAEAEHDHEHGAIDLHIWLDPANAVVLVDAIAAELAAVDPANAARYEDNAAAARAGLASLQAELADRLAGIADRPYIVFHDAYQYFEARFGLQPAGAITIGPERRPGAKRLQQIHERLRALDAACVFAEPQFEPTLVKTVTEGTAARTGVLDPLGAELAPGPEQYGQLLHQLADSLTGCLGERTSG
jgi:zinc transport system substrate-binding protein